MAHHKRKRHKNARAGCLMCKPQKGNGMKGKEEYQTRQEKIARISEREQLQERTSCPDCGSIRHYNSETGECVFCMIMF